MGCLYCRRTAPIAVSLASDTTSKGLLNTGICNRGAFVRSCFMPLNADSQASVHLKEWSIFVRSVRGATCLE